MTQATKGPERFASCSSYCRDTIAGGVEHTTHCELARGTLGLDLSSVAVTKLVRELETFMCAAIAKGAKTDEEVLLMATTDFYQRAITMQFLSTKSEAVRKAIEKSRARIMQKSA